MLNLDNATKAAIAKNVHNTISFIELIPDPEDPNKDVRFSTAVYNIYTKGNIWYGMGGLLGVGKLTDNAEAKSNTIEVSLSGLNETVLELLDANELNGARISLFKGFRDLDTGLLVAEPFMRWSGVVNSYANTIMYNENGSGSVVVALSCESLLTVLLGSKNSRVTNDTTFSYQNNGDRSMAYVAALAQWSPDFGADRESD